MEQMTNENEQRVLKDKTDYIDIPAFVRSFLRYARKYILFVIPLAICVSVCLSILSRPYTKKNYVAGGTAMIGIRLANSGSFDYTISELSWDRHSTIAQMDTVLSTLLQNGYIDQYVSDFMGKKRGEALNGQIYMNAVYAANLVDIHVVSDSPEDAKEIRDAVFACLPDAVFPAVGFIEMDIEELYTREESSSKAFLASPIVWVAGGAVAGTIGYLGLIFLYTWRRRDSETPEDVSKLTDLACIGRLPELKKGKHSRKGSSADVLIGSLPMTEEYRREFEKFRRTLAEEILEHDSRVILLTGCGHQKGQSSLAAGLEKSWSDMGKKVTLLDLSHNKERLTEETVRESLNQCMENADIVLIDGPAFDQTSDSLILADCADMMIMVIREGQCQPDELKEMFRSLKYTNAAAPGYVLNICSNMAV